MSTSVIGAPDILREIVEHKRKEVAARAIRVKLATLKKKVGLAGAARGFVSAIQNKIAGGLPAVIAECKKASPSRGVIRKDYSPTAIANSYAAAGATCLSVLTDVYYFQGADDHLIEARGACALPVIRKDFMIDPYQVYESRILGADCILLIAACLPDALMRELATLATDLGMDVLVEVHNRKELERAHLLRTPLIGINNRDLRSFTTDLKITLDLLVDVMSDRIVVTESGIHTREDVALMRRRGVDAFLVGEAFMSAADPGAKLKELFSL